MLFHFFKHFKLKFWPHLTHCTFKGSQGQRIWIEHNVVSIPRESRWSTLCILEAAHSPGMCCQQHMLLHVATHLEENTEIASPSLFSQGLWKIHSAGPEYRQQQADSCLLDYRLHSYFITLPSTLNGGWRSRSKRLFPQGGCCLFALLLILNRIQRYSQAPYFCLSVLLCFSSAFAYRFSLLQWLCFTEISFPVFTNQT